MAFLAAVSGDEAHGESEWALGKESSSVPEESRLEVVRHGLVHHRTIPVTLDVVVQSLQHVTPGDFADLLAQESPACEVLKLRPEFLRELRIQKVDEGVTEAHPGLEVNGQVDQVVGSIERFVQ
eukprot:CAMPEP_0170613306 /NCGR_PEP_ID=MMETSP0224-20130122/24203_1 /TAXON_ID=285029 /ORGANISM="Togula jolla, Strain CCCM 725" /LENGTH=123 /DNA_ID=CAMNT_0010938901 /DNA_START=58 /DNA_END=430 /DNA_ORIENTATION=+